MSWETRIEHVAITDVGLRRSNNQDAYAVMIAGSPQQWQQQGHLFLVADGMGAHAAGELASKLSADHIPHIYSKLRNQPTGNALSQSIKEANAEIYHRGQTNAEFNGMGTTTSVLLLGPEGATLGHVGDSRVYRLRANGQIEQLSFDHSLVWELRARGQLKGVNPDNVPKNIITRSLGPGPEVDVDLEGPFAVEVGDVFLLCSDGLSGQVEDDEMGAILASMPPQEAAQALVDLGNLRGGPDNITLIIAKVISPLDTVAEPDPDFADDSNDSMGTGLIIAWVAVFVLLVAAVFLFLMNSLPLAVICVIGSIITGLVAWQNHPKGSSPLAALNSSGGRYGRGPYRMCKAALDKSFTDRLSTLVDELRQAATNEDWDIDWDAFKKNHDSAINAASQNDFATAVRGFCLSISFMMSELRNQRSRVSKQEEG